VSEGSSPKQLLSALARRDIHPSLSPVEKPANPERINLQRFDAVRKVGLVIARAGGQVCAEVRFGKQERHALVSGFGHVHGF
jgi:hypothetical protein